jgi:hypothetical protein
VVKGVHTDPEHVAAAGWDAATPAHHIEGAVMADFRPAFNLSVIARRAGVDGQLRAASEV